MPVTAKLSRKFYERLGDDIAGELVDWFNAVDATYQQQLRDTNDLNWGRFEAKFEAQSALLRSELAAFRAEMAAMRTDLLKWMFVYWTGTVATLGGLIIGLAVFVAGR